MLLQHGHALNAVFRLDDIELAPSISARMERFISESSTIRIFCLLFMATTLPFASLKTAQPAAGTNLKSE